MDCKKCLKCETKYDANLKHCPECHSSKTSTFVEEQSSTTNVIADVVEVIADVAIAIASGAAEVASSTFSSLSDIDFGGGGAGDLFD